MRIGIEEGADIMGYCPWSAIDLVSTREGISKRYGFVYVDRNEDDNAAKTAEMKRYRKGMMPKPLPPDVTTFRSFSGYTPSMWMRSRASPLLGSAPSQK